MFILFILLMIYGYRENISNGKAITIQMTKVYVTKV